MNPSTLPRFEPMTTGVLLDRAFRLYTGNFALMLGIAAAAYVPFYLIMLVIESTLGGNLPAHERGLSALLFQLVFVILWASIAFPIATGATTFAISERYLGKEITIGAALRRGLSNLWSLSIAQITATIRVMFGLLLLIVPGILWALSYSLVVPVISVEGEKALPSLRRSRDLIKGYRGKAFCILLVVNLLQLALMGGVGLIAGMLFSSETPGGSILASAVNNLLSIVFAPLGIIAAILLYYDMRIRKEGFDLEMLSQAMVSEPQGLAAQPTASR